MPTNPEINKQVEPVLIDQYRAWLGECLREGRKFYIKRNSKNTDGEHFWTEAEQVLVVDEGIMLKYNLASLQSDAKPGNILMIWREGNQVHSKVITLSRLIEWQMEHAQSEQAALSKRVTDLEGELKGANEQIKGFNALINNTNFIFIDKGGTHHACEVWNISDRSLEQTERFVLFRYTGVGGNKELMRVPLNQFLEWQKKRPV